MGGRAESPARAAPVRFGGNAVHLRWALVALAGGAIATVYYLRLDPSAFAARGQWWLGLWSALGYLSTLVYSARKRFGIARFRPLRPWYVGHVWLSVAGLGIGLLHADFALGGWSEGALLVLFAVALLSGVLLVLVQDRFKARIIALEAEHLLPEDILEQRTRLATEVAELLSAGRPELRAAVDAELLSALASRSSRWRTLFRGRADAVEEERLRLETACLRRLQPAGAGERAVLARVVQCSIEGRHLAAQQTLHRLRRGFTTLHYVLAGAGLALLVIHVALVRLH